jgi:hypothetical protein
VAFVLLFGVAILSAYGAVQVAGTNYKDILDNLCLLDCSTKEGTELEQCVDQLADDKFSQPIVGAVWPTIYVVGIGLAAFTAAFGKAFGDPA